MPVTRPITEVTPSELTARTSLSGPRLEPCHVTDYADTNPMFFGSRAHHQVRAASESIQKRDEVRFLLLCEAQAEAYFVEMHSVHKGLRRAVMKVGGTGSEAPKNWP